LELRARKPQGIEEAMQHANKAAILYRTVAEE